MIPTETIKGIAVEARGVTKQFQQGPPILRRIDLRVDPGLFVTIRGPSGSGKTTLLHLLATLDRPDEGEIVIDDKEVTAWNAEALSRLRRRALGILHQDAGLITRFKVWQNVSLPLIPDGIPPRERRARSAQCLEELGMVDLLDRRTGLLSGGEKQRVGLARALINTPGLLIADEPTSQVDARTAAHLVEHLTQLQNRGMTIVCASHAPELCGPADVCYDLDAASLTIATPS